MLIIGFAISQSVLALLILIDWPVSRVLNNAPFLLCIIAGIIQGFFEEGGRYFAFTKILKRTEPKTSILYGIGHGGVELVYTLIVAIASNLALSAIGI